MKYLLLSVSLISFFSCVSVRYEQDISAYQSKIESLEEQLSSSSSDASALRDLGAIYFQTGGYRIAQRYLKQSYTINNEDPKTCFFYGMTLEFNGFDQDAMKVYERFPELTGISPYRKLISGRYYLLQRQILYAEVQQLIQKEESDYTQIYSPMAVAVFPFIYQGESKRFEPLARGISELIITDLGKVEGLQLLERIRVQALLDELAFGQSKYVDPATAPRLGRLIGAGKIVSGSFNVLNRDQFWMNVAFVDMEQGESPEFQRELEDTLEELFRLQKAAVFQILDALGVDITPVVRQEIEAVPTNNLQAFLAYCKGLESQDEGKYRQAAKFFRRAGNLDPNFQEAKVKQVSMENVNFSGGTWEQAVTKAQTIELSLQTGLELDTQQLLESRFTNTESNVNSSFEQGAESRTVDEVSKAVPLPPPPPPPPPQEE